MSESEPLFRRLSSPTMKASLSRRNLLSPVNPKRGDLALLASCFVTGILDCAIFNHYGVFIAMQTGNTVILCLSTAGYPSDSPYIYALTMVSLASFLVGCFVTARVSEAFGPLRRITITSQFLTQALLITLAAILVTSNVIPNDSREKNPRILSDARIIGALPALAFQSGSTMATSRFLGYGGEIPVNVLTSTYAALATDTKLFRKDNPPRNRRVAAVLCLASGALCAAWIQKAGPGIKAVLWIGAAIKLVLATLIGLLLPNAPANE